MAKILVIEDNTTNMYLTVFILKKHKHEVIEATNGPDGIEKARLNRPDLILLDIQLPDMDGYTVAGTLKKDDLTCNIPIIAITSYAMHGDRERILAAGCEGYMEKPINPVTFIEEIANYLG